MAIFKNGDDLRQDILTLQMIEIMDRIWLDNDLDLAMTPYKVINTGCDQGMMEFLHPTVTMADIQHKDFKSLKSTFSERTVQEFFENEIEKELKESDKRF